MTNILVWECAAVVQPVQAARLSRASAVVLGLKLESLEVVES